MRTITRLFDSHTEAFSALDELERAGVDHDRISVVSNNVENWHAGHRHGGEVDEPGAAKETTAGATIGGAAGFAAGLSVMALPGLGAAAVAGWLVAALVGTALGAAAGGAAGGLIGSLTDAGHTEEEAHIYSEGVRRGGTLISVKVSDDDAGKVQRILDSQRGVDAALRGDLYRQSGWTRHDPTATPYTAEQVRAERLRFQENRSFAQSESNEDISDDERARRASGLGAGATFSGGPD